ncbi:MAG TPA: hypothetical protein VFI31_16900 [Pirellulales bacterium]|nr:hypothetical protein [Pirellulales bacterium]
MLDFQPKGRTRNYMARGEQRKLLGIVLAVGLVLFLIEEAANPQRWMWMWQAAQPAAANPRKKADVEQPPELRRRVAAPGEFIAEGEHQEELPVHKQFFPGVDRELLSKVRDDTPFRSGEAGAFYHLLGILQAAPEAEIEKGSIGPVSFMQLFGQPKEFRGDLVTIEGTVRRAQKKTAAKNDYGITDYDLLIVEPSDRAYAVWLYALGLPEGFPRGEKLREPITVTGFFYKRLAALSEDKEIMTWPVLLAKTVHRRPVLAAAPGANQQAEVKSLAGGLAVAVLASLVVVVFVFVATRRKTRFVMPASRPNLDHLHDERLVPDVRQQLAELARHERP